MQLNIIQTMFKKHYCLTIVVNLLTWAGVCNGYPATAPEEQVQKSLPFEDCGSKYDILFLSISSCSSIPCKMDRDSTVLVHTIFDDSGKNTVFLKHSVRWIFNAIKTPATITPDPCDGKDQCISNDREGTSYWASVFVNSNLPVMRGTMVWEAYDNENKNVLCFKLPVLITLTS